MRSIEIKKGNINSILPKNSQFNEDISVHYNPDHFRFQCNHCGACCDRHSHPIPPNRDLLRVVVCDIDINTILKFCKPPILGQFFTSTILENTGDQVITLVKKDGACIFYDRKNRSCAIYKKRPLMCRAFPWALRQQTVIGPDGTVQDEKLAVILQDTIPCDPECFEAPSLSSKKIAAIIKSGLILEKRKKLAKQRLIREQKRTLASLNQKKVHRQRNWLVRLGNGIVDHEDSAFVSSKSGERLFFKRWVVCKDGEVLEKIKNYNEAEDTPPIEKMPVDFSNLRLGQPMATILEYFIDRDGVVGFQLLFRRFDEPAWAKFDSFPPGFFLHVHRFFMDGKMLENPEIAEALPFFGGSTEFINLSES